MSDLIEDPCDECSHPFDRYAHVCPKCGFQRRVRWLKIGTPRKPETYASWEIGSYAAPTCPWTLTEQGDAVFRMVGTGANPSWVNLLDDEDQLGVFIYMKWMHGAKGPEIASSLNDQRKRGWGVGWNPDRVSKKLNAFCKASTITRPRRNHPRNRKS
jgi:hypothetical protein